MPRRLLLLLTPLLLTVVAYADPNPPAPGAAVPNDNHVAAGERKGNVLTLQLEIVDSTWYPQAPDGRQMHVYAFAEKGRPPQIPGPLLRVPQGTEVHLELHNTLAVAMFVRGLQTAEPVALAPGGTTKVQFTAGAPGTFYYSARSCKMSLSDLGLMSVVEDLPMGEPPFGIESQLVGALIVDPPGAPVDDHIFIITTWMGGVITPPFREVVAINGKNWPYTERLSYRVGDSARWRLINASVSDHAMHLHGFHFLVNSAGGQDRDQVYSPQEAFHKVTQRLEPGATSSLTWVPSRAGRWLFHCHMTGHMVSSVVTEEGGAEQHSSTHTMPPDSAGMMGMVIGITVSPGTTPAANPPSTQKARQLKLFVRETPATPVSVAQMGYSIQEEGAKEPTGPPPVPGAPLVLTRGEPTEITVVNQLTAPTSVHWHGIEIESYYDGVVAYGGDSPQMTPPIPPGGTFVARMTPPRAGTFIYHTHWHDVDQLTSGLYGPLIVMEPGEKFDPTKDKIFVVSRQNSDLAPTSVLSLNGTPQPIAMGLKAGTKYRLRLINIGSNDADVEVSLLGGDGKPVEWRALAKDGWTLSAAQATTRPAFQPITVGETYDFEFQSDHAADFTLQVRARFAKFTISQIIGVR